MVYQYNRINNLKYLEANRKNLRKNPTTAEAHLWTFLRKKKIMGKRFRRQFSVADYILDFYCFEAKLAVELDGEPHYSEEGMAMDYERDAFLEEQGIRVLRFENRRVWEDMKGALGEIKECL